MKVSEHVYCRIGEGSESNNGFIVCDECCIVVDTSAYPDLTQEDLKDMREITNKEVKFLINTHYHADHTFGNMFFTDIIAHKNCYESLKEAIPRYMKYVEDDIENKESYKDFVVKLPTLVFTNEITLFEPFEIRLIRCGGHTAGSSIVYIPHEKVLFSGDLLFAGIHPYTGNADIPRWITVLGDLLQLDVTTIVPGHGELCDKEEIKSHIDYLNTLYSTLKDLKKKYTKEEICQNVDLLGLPERDEKEMLAQSLEGLYDII